MKLVIKWVVALFAKLYPPRLSFRMQVARNTAYSLWIREAFGSIGQSPYIARPMHLKGGQYIHIGDHFIAEYRNRIEAFDRYGDQHFTPRITIGNNVCMNYDCHIGAINHIEIGDNVLIGSRVLITDHNHGQFALADLSLPPIKRQLHSKAGVVIHNNVWIGEGVSILAGVTIGQNSIIAANSVVSTSVPANCVVGGIPARIIKELK